MLEYSRLKFDASNFANLADETVGVYPRVKKICISSAAAKAKRHISVFVKKLQGCCVRVIFLVLFLFFTYDVHLRFLATSVFQVYGSDLGKSFFFGII